MGVNNLIYSKDGMRLTELFEGDVLTAYQDQRGIWTIGYGHTADVHPGQKITEQEAEQYLAEDIRAAANFVNRVVRVTVTQGQFDALVDFAFNVGITNFGKSTLLREVNEGLFPEASAQFDLWDHCGGVVNAGLLRRRNAEMAEFGGEISANEEIA